MSNEDADAENDTRCRDDLGHSSPPSGAESSTGSFPDDFIESGKWFRRLGRRRRPGTEEPAGGPELEADEHPRPMRTER
jgi:hypothetical protein